MAETALGQAPLRQPEALAAATDLTAGEIAERFNISKLSISKHLSVLENAGLISSERRGQFIHYSQEEAELSRSQIAILNSGRGSNIKYLPRAFTEHGAIQAANVLNSPRAAETGVYVVRAFAKVPLRSPTIAF